MTQTLFYARHLCLAAGLAIIGASSSSAQLTTATIVPSQASTESNISTLIGTKVVNEASEPLGDVNYLLVNSSGQITTVVVGVGGFLGVGEKNVGFPYAALNFGTGPQGERTIKLKTTKSELEAAPKFAWRETPMAVTVEEKLKTAADKVKETAKSLGEKASDAMKKN